MVPCLHQGNIYNKQNYGYGETRNVFPYSVQKPFLPVRAVKVPHVKGVGVRPRTQTCVNWSGRITMVLCLYQGSIYIKRKVRVRRDKKCILLLGAQIPLTCVGRQTIPSKGRRCRVDTGNLRKLGWTYCHGTVFAPRQCLYQKEGTGVERREMYSPSRCKNLCYLFRSSHYSVSRESV